MTTAKTSCVPIGAEASIADLLLRVGDGDPTAWEEIVGRYSELVFATVRTFRLQDADMLDATQTTWLHLAEHAHQIRHPERLGGWLVTTARRICLRIVKHANHPLGFFDPMTETHGGCGILSASYHLADRRRSGCCSLNISAHTPR